MSEQCEDNFLSVETIRRRLEKGVWGQQVESKQGKTEVEEEEMKYVW